MTVSVSYPDWSFIRIKIWRLLLPVLLSCCSWIWGDEGRDGSGQAQRGTPRIANRLLRRVRDYADVKNNGVIDAEIADAALSMLDVDGQGLDVMDRKFLEAILHKFSGGPVGLENVAAAIGESTDTIEDVIEPLSDSAGLFAAYTARTR